MKHDYIIVGGGIAGSVLALTFKQRGKSVLLIDLPKSDSASKVAAGLFNPVTGKRSVLTWKAHLIFPYLHQFYQYWQNKFSNKFFFSTNIYKPFNNISEMNDLMGKSADEMYKPFIKEIVSQPVRTDVINNSLGGIFFQQCGYLNVKKFLAATVEYLQKNNEYLIEKFEPNLLNLKNDKIDYKGIKVERVIFCEGASVSSNPFFNWLKMDPVKGELIEFTTEREPGLDFIVNRDMFLLPLASNRFLAGATYDKANLDTQNTAEGRMQIVNKLQRFFKPEINVVNQCAGVRPATRDRRPFVGMHPENKLLAVFNGFGTKGVSLAPFFANQLADVMLNKKEFDKEINISRF